MIIEKTYEELVILDQVGSNYLRKNKNKENKITVSLINFAKQLRKINDDITEEYSNLELDNCLTGEKGEILYYPNGKKMITKEAEKKIKEGMKKFYKTKTSIHSRIPENIDENLLKELTEEELEAFSGILIPLIDN